MNLGNGILTHNFELFFFFLKKNLECTGTLVVSMGCLKILVAVAQWYAGEKGGGGRFVL